MFLKGVTRYIRQDSPSFSKSVPLKSFDAVKALVDEISGKKTGKE